MATPYFAAEAQGPVGFPVSGAPVCVSLGAPFWRGNMRPVLDEGTGATFIELTGTIIHATATTEKFYLEPSRNHEGLVHIKCCGNDKYWVAEQHEREDGTSGWFICASADEPEEDPAKLSCTLFEFRQQPDEGIEGYNARLFHHQQKKNVLFVVKAGTSDIYNLEVRDYQESDYVPSIICVRRLSLQKPLPKHVAFKDSNGKYLTLKGPYLQFSSSDITDPAVAHETFTDEYGIVRIRSNRSDGFWRLRVEEGWICAEYGDAIYEPQPVYKNRTVTEESYADVNTLFRVVIKSDNHIALQSMGNGKFCKSLTDDGQTECLSACIDESSTTSDVELEIEEPPVKADEIVAC